MDSILGSLIVLYKANIDNLTANSAIARTEMQETGAASSGMGGMVAGGALVAGAAIIAFAASSVGVAANFQQSMLKVQAYAGLSKQATSDMGDAILTMAAKVGVKPTELADAIYPIVSSGYDAAQSLNILQLSAETAAASGAKTSVVADMLTTSLKATHAPAQDAGKYMDMFNTIVAEGKGEVPAYAAVIGKLALAAGSAHVPFGDMGAALATLTTHGFPSVAQGANALGNMFTQIGPKVDALAAHAAKLGISFDENKFKSMDLSDKMSYLSKITDGNQGSLLKLMGGSTLALKAFDALSGSAKDYASNLEGMNKSQGKTASVFATTSAGWNATVARMSASFEVLQVKVGTALLPIITSLGNAFIPVMNNFGTLITAIQNGTGFFQQSSIGMDALKSALAGIGIAVLLFAITQIPVMVAALGAMAVAGWLAIVPLLPFIAIGLAVALVIFGIVEAVKRWGAISTWLSGVWNAGVHDVGNFFSWLGDHVHQVLDSIGNFFHVVWNGILDFLKMVGMVMLAIIIGPIGLAVIYIVTHWTQVKTFLAGIWGDITGAATSAWNGLTTGISSALTKMWDWVNNFFGGLPAQMVQFGINLIQGLINGILSMIGNVGSAIGSIASKIGSFLPHSPAKEGELSHLNEYGPSLVKGFASGIDGSASILTASVAHMVSVGTYPIRPSAIGVASAIAPSVASQNSSTGDHTTIVQLDSLEITRMVQKQTDKLVKLKLGAKGRLI